MLMMLSETVMVEREPHSKIGRTHCLYICRARDRHWPFLYHRRISRLGELCQLDFSSSDSSSIKFANIKTGNRRIICLNTQFVEK